MGPLKCRRAPQATAEEAERRPGLLHCRVEVTGVEAQAGDQQSFMEQVAHMLPLAQRLAYGMLQNAHECEDALQDASFKAWRAFPRLREGSDLRALVPHDRRQGVPPAPAKRLVVDAQG